MSIVGHVKRFWRFHSLIIGAFGICAFTLGCAVQEPAYYEGTWVVTKAYNVGVSAHSSIESEKFLDLFFLTADLMPSIAQMHKFSKNNLNYLKNDKI